MEKRILHILEDDKFSDYAFEQFEQLSIPSDYVLMNTSNHVELVKHRDKMIAINNRDAYNKLIASLSNYTAVILHGMFWWFDREILNHVPATTKVAWVNWGGEIYGRKDVYYDFLSPVSGLLERLNNWKKRTFVKDYREHHFEVDLNLFRRVDYCLTDEYEEFEYARTYLQKPDLQYLMYNYYTLEDMIGALMDKRCKGNHIFLGNCGANECNYWEAIPKVSRLKERGQKVIVPLGYGAPWVKNWVMRFGKLFFRKDFMPLIDFLPREQYNELICNCSTMIMPHYAPRAQGNIITALWLGMRVYLSEHNMTYHYFKRLGCTVYSIEKDLKRSNKECFKPMTDEELEHNRKILYATYSRESTMKAVQHIAETLTRE